MRPAEKIHLVKVKAKGKHKKVMEIDIRKSPWDKIRGKWINPEGLSPIDKESIEKVENWVRQITRISANLDQTDGITEEINLEEVLDQQLSAVEGHKKVEIIDHLKLHGPKRVDVTQPLEEAEQTPLGIELEKKPWIDNAKKIAALLSGVSIAIIIVLANNLRDPKEQSILSSVTPSNTHRVGFSSPIKLDGIGHVYLYNQNWNEKLEKEDIIEQVKPAAIQILSSYSNLQLEKVEFPKEEIRKRVAAIDKNKTPMLVVIPEGKEQKENNTKLWISKTGQIFLERTIKTKTTWEMRKMKDPEDNTIKEMKLPFLNEQKK
jgi:vacuolar-type H+-ATPase subunit F/Vma7